MSDQARVGPARDASVIGPDELDALRESVRGTCSRRWPAATAAQDGDLAALWAAGAAQGWTAFGDPGLLAAAIAVQEELGRVACPLPVVDIAIVAAVLEARGAEWLVADTADGALRPIVAAAPLADPAGVVARHLDMAPVATHLLVVDDAAGALAWFSLEGAEREALPGLAAPAWWQVRPAGSPEWVASLDDHPELLVLRRLGVGVRAMAAVGRTHELAVEHAKGRHQFGRAIGSFQAVSHRLVDTEIALAAARHLLDHALALHARGDAGWLLAAEVYLEFVQEKAAGLQFAGHHTLAAIGYFEEHEAPWLFRRAHADLALLSAIGREGGGVGALLLDRGHRLPDHNLGPSAEIVRNEVLEAFGPWMGGPPSHLRSWDDAARAVFRDRGWIGVGWPREVGGGGYDVAEMLAFSEALAYANPPLGNIMMGVNSIAPMMIAVATPQLRELALTEIRRGDLSIALGYSEPEAGSDLASLRTRADRVEGGWRINGQKMWGTCFPDSRYVLLAARTDPDAKPRHAGISLFLVDADSPGITAHEHRSLGGDISATTFWDDVFVPEERLVGEVNGGWAALSAALAGERVLIGASVMRAHRAFDRLVDLVSRRPEAVVRGRAHDVRAEIGRLAVRLQAARALVAAGVEALMANEKGTAGSGGGRKEAPMAKILATELAEDLNATAVALLGPDALYAFGVDGAAGEGYFEDGLRNSIMGVIAGGTGDVQRNLVARGMGLPR